MEIVGPSWRTFTGTFIHMFWTFGYIMLAGIAYAARDRFTLQLCTSIPLAVLFIYYWVIPESPRWLLAKGRNKEARSIISNIAKTNGVELPGNIEIIKDESTPTPLKIMRTANIRNITLVLFFLWSTNNIVYYGLSWNTSNLGGNAYLNFFLTGVEEIPAHISKYILLKRCNRRYAFAAVMTTCGLILVATWLAPEDPFWLPVMLTIIGKFAISISFGILYVYSAEFFPTVMRNMGLGACNIFSRCIGILVPYTADLDEIQKGLLLLIFGTLSLIAAALIMLLPNTKTTQLAQTIEEGESKLKLHAPTLCCKKKTTATEKAYVDKPDGNKSVMCSEMKPFVAAEPHLRNVDDNPD